MSNNIMRFFMTTLIISIVLIFSVQAEETSEKQYSGEYTIEYLIGKYNVITLGQNKPIDTSWYNSLLPNGTLLKFIHIVGPLLVEGNLGTEENQSTDHSQRVYGTSSYIQGKIVARGHAGGNSENTDNTNPNFYLGEDNTIEKYCEIYNWGCNPTNENNYRINGFDYYTKYPTYKDSSNSQYLDFSKLYDEIVEEQKNLKSGETIESYNSDIYIKSGGVYTIESVKEVNNIHITNYNKDELTLITINDADNISKFPRILLDNNEISTNDYIYKNGDNEKYYGNIVFSLPNVRHVMMTQAPFIGHFIAPNADVEMPEMHFAGAFIVNSLRGSGNSEAHMYPYKLGELPKEENLESNSNSNEVGNNPSNNTSNINSNEVINDESNDMSNINSSDIVSNDSVSNIDKEVKGAIENPQTIDKISFHLLIILVSSFLTNFLTIVILKYNDKKEI